MINAPQSSHPFNDPTPSHKNKSKLKAYERNEMPLDSAAMVEIPTRLLGRVDEIYEPSKPTSWKDSALGHEMLL